MTRPGGLIVTGEPYWLQNPSQEYLDVENMTSLSYRSHMENVLMGGKHGLNCVYNLASDHEDWDYYESLHWRSAVEYVDENPEDPDNSEILEKAKQYRDTYLRWGRDTMGWSLYVFRKPLYML